MTGSHTTALLDERFLLLDAIGHGGMGQVVRAFDARYERVVALKIPLRPGDAGASQRLVEEFETWSRIRHRNVVRALGLGTARRGPLSPGTPYLVLERFPGAPLPRALTPGRTEASRIERVAREALAALAVVHDAGLVHRDVKPSNLLVRARDGGGVQLKLIDFGLATRSGAAGVPGELSGCIPYLSPEAILGLALDGRADLYALGVALYRQATGRHPAPRADADGLLRWHLAGERPRREPHLAALPERLSRFILRLLERCRDDRPATAADAARMLEAPLARAGMRPTVARTAELAALRLALDACRRGARRAMALPDRGPGGAFSTDAAVQAEARGFEVVRLGGQDPADDVVGVTLRLLCATGAAARSPAPIALGLPISFAGAQALRDTSAIPANRLRCGSRTARFVADLLVEASASRPVALIVDRASGDDPAVAGVLRELRKRERPEDGSAGGLLVLAPAPRTTQAGRAGITGRPRARGRARGRSESCGYEQPLVAPQLMQT